MVDNVIVGPDTPVVNDDSVGEGSGDEETEDERSGSQGATGNQENATADDTEQTGNGEAGNQGEDHGGSAV